MLIIAFLCSVAGTFLNGTDTGNTAANMILGYFIGVEDKAGQVMFGEGELCYYHISTPDALICITTAITMFGIYNFIGKHLSDRATKFVFRIGTDMTAFYFIHWIFVALIVQLFLNLVRGTTAPFHAVYPDSCGDDHSSFPDTGRCLEL